MSISKEFLEDCLKSNLSTRQIALRLACSQTNVRHYLRKYKLSTKTKNVLFCEVCNSSLTGNQVRFCSNSCKSRGSYLNRNSFSYQTARAVDRKTRLVNMRGGCCEMCGYSKCLAALDFHHFNGIKNFPLSSRNLSNTSWDRIMEEFKNCKVLCSNCHREVHYS